jgi:hypothetical protein
MKTLRFHRSIYVADALSEAVAVFAQHGDVRVDDSSADHIIVHLRASDHSEEDALAGMFANYALGASAHAHQRLPE